MSKEDRIEWAAHLQIASRGISRWTGWLRGSVGNSQTEEWKLGLRRLRSELLAVEDLLKKAEERK